MARPKAGSKHFPDQEPLLRLGKTLHSPIQDRFRKLIREARIQAGFTQIQAAQLLGVPQNFISNIERGERRVDVVEFVTFCQVYKLDASRFFKNLVSNDLPEA